MPNAALVARVLLLTGPSGAGKSATAIAFAASRRSTTAVLDQDLVRTFIKSGFARPDTDWGPEAERQWLLSRQICLDAIARYAESTVDCVIDAYAPGPWSDEWRCAMPSGVRFDAVVLRPAFEIAATRNDARPGHRTDPSAHARNYETFDGPSPVPGAVLIDNSHLTIEEVVLELEHHLNWP